MDIKELQDYRLTDAVRFHQNLNPKIWGSDEQLLPEVREKLLAIAEDFKEFLGISNLEVKDITISGSNAAYTYTDHSDIDLHLVADLPKADASDVYRELFDAKKYQYNDQHDFKIGGIPVELYVQNANQEPESQGIYSVVNNEWISVPKRRKPTIDDISVRSKYEDIGRRIEAAIESGDSEKLNSIAHKVKAMRQAGLDKTGEFGPENLAFKVLRSNGTLDQLRAARSAAKSRELSIDEEKNKKKKTRYGFGGMWFPGYHYYGDSAKVDDDTVTPDDIGADEVEESAGDIKTTLNQFAAYCIKRLGIENPPKLQLKKDPAWSERNATFGQYNPATGIMTLSVANRHLVDIMRTLAHELVHRRQDEVERLPNNSGETGSKWENQANAEAGKIMRDWGAEHPELFDKKPLSEATGYIPVNDEEARDPRYAMAITVDIKPGEVQRQAAKMGWKTDRAGHPQVARTNGLVETLKNKLQNLKENKSVDEHITNQIGWEESVDKDEQLDEVNMSPGALADWAKSAGEMKSGFEAELIFPGFNDDEYEPEYENDYDQDERARSIDNIIDFFSNGDQADLSQRAQERLRQEMLNDYHEWLNEQMMDDWSNDQDDYVLKWIIDNEDPDLSEEEQEEMRDQAISRQNDIYDSALEEYSDEWNHSTELDQDDWLSSNGISYMTDAENSYELTWPYMVDNGHGPSDTGGFDAAGAKSLADSLSEELGVKTTVSTGYHNARRDTESWIFEPDSSVHGDESSDMPVEIVSPPMSLNKTLEIMPKFFDWVKSHDGYANRSTGFHMSVSMPNHDWSELDYIKLAVFLGDKFVLDQFGRAGNTYCQNAIDKIQSKLKDRSDKDKEEALANMRHGLNKLASQSLVHPSGFGKYVSINPKNNYVEFRSAGGEDYFEDMDKIRNTMMRYARALSIAMDPNAEKQEYAKKLYKTLTDVQTQQVTDPKTGTKRTEVKTGDDDAISLFSRYVAGEIPKAALRSFIKQLQMGREAKRQAAAGKPTASSSPGDSVGNYVIRRRDNLNSGGVGPVLHRFTAAGIVDAIENASEWARAQGLDRSSIWLTPVEEVPPELLTDRPEQPATADLRPQADLANLRSAYPADLDGWYALRRRGGGRGVIEYQGAGRILHQFYATTTSEAIDKKRQWCEQNNMPYFDIWLERLENVPESIRQEYNRNLAQNSQAAPAAPTQEPGRHDAALRTLQRAYPHVLCGELQTTSPTGQWVIFSGTSYENVALVPGATGGDALWNFHYWISDIPGDRRDRYHLRPADQRDIDMQTGSHLQPDEISQFVQDLEPETSQNSQQPIGNHFSGRWKIVSANTGEIVHEFGGIGNVQANALRVAREWVEQTGFDDPIEVYPIMQ